jgi:molybdopterin molybdotransferase
VAQTFFKVVTPQEALRALLQVSSVGTERIPTVRARARVLAEDLYSSVDLPHFHRAAMDGYAVKAKDTFGASQSLPAYLKLTGVVEMGKEATQRLGAGEAIRISTGGMMPPESDAVVMVEYTDETDAGLVEIHRSVSPWQNVIRYQEKRAGFPARAAAQSPRFGCSHRCRDLFRPGLHAATHCADLHRG